MSNIFALYVSIGEGTSTISDILPDGTISNMPWRKTGVQYSQNEIYLDIIEEIDAIVDKNGHIITCKVKIFHFFVYIVRVKF